MKPNETKQTLKMADSDTNSVQSPIIMKVDGPAEDNEELENGANEKAESAKTLNNITEIKPSQICSPIAARPVLGASRLGNTSPFTVHSGSSNSPILRPSQFSFGNSNNSNTNSNTRSHFSLNPSRLNLSSKSATDDKSETNTDDKTENNVAHTNGETPKFVPLLQTESKLPSVPAKPSTSSVPPTNNFVFGQNLQDRVIADGKTDDSKPSTSINSNGTSDMLFTNAIGNSEIKSETNKELKSLSESAREYEELRAAKRKYDEVEVKTGEEGETNIIQLSCKLFAFDKASGSWQERGRGNLRLNDLELTDESGSYTQSRLVFRTSGSLRVVLNTKIWAEMTVQEASAKSIRLTAIDPNGEIKVFLISAGKEDMKQLYEQLNLRVKNEIERQKHKNPTQAKKPEENLETCPKKPNIDTGGN